MYSDQGFLELTGLTGHLPPFPNPRTWYFNPRTFLANPLAEKFFALHASHFVLGLMKFHDTPPVPLIFYSIQTIQALVMTFGTGVCVCEWVFISLCLLCYYVFNKKYMGYCTPYQFELLVAAPEHIPLSSCGPLEEKVGHPWRIVTNFVCHTQCPVTCDERHRNNQGHIESLHQPQSLINFKKSEKQ